MKRTDNASHKVPIWALVACALAIGAGCAGWALCTGHTPDAAMQEELPQQDQQQVGEEEAGDDVMLSERQSQQIARYTTAELDVIGTLKSGSWSSESANAVLTFGDDSYTIRAAGGSQESHPYSISSVEQESHPADGDVLKITTCAMETDAGTYVLTLQASTSIPGAMTVSSKAFNPTTYALTPSAHVLAVEGVSAEVAAAMGGNGEAISQALADFCKAAFPAANKATCTGVIIIDLNEHEASTTFLLDNSAKTKITLTYDEKTGTFAAA